MNLEKMLDAQKAFDDRIIKDKGLEGQDLFPNTILALQVELAEFAQEGRWFKHWSNYQKPRTKIEHLCPFCDEGFHQPPYQDEPTVCEECDGNYILGVTNPLLEEFSDGVHFFLSIANQKGWQNALWIYEEQLDDSEFDGDLTAWYLELVYYLNLSYMCKYPEDDKIAGFQRNAYYFRIAWIFFLNLGINGFGFTVDQIEKAYFEKHQINYLRLENGY